MEGRFLAEDRTVVRVDIIGESDKKGAGCIAKRCNFCATLEDFGNINIRYVRIYLRQTLVL